jgi:hypothetical protein
VSNVIYGPEGECDIDAESSGSKIFNRTGLNRTGLSLAGR